MSIGRRAGRRWTNLAALVALAGFASCVSRADAGDAGTPTTTVASAPQDTTASPPTTVAVAAPAVGEPTTTVAVAAPPVPAPAALPVPATAAPAIDLGDDCPGMTGGVHRLVAGGHPRAYRLAVPGDLDRAAPAPLLIFLHGYSATVDLFLPTTGLTTAAPAAGVVLAAPQAIGEPTGWHLGDPAFGDVEYLDALVEELTSSPCIDASEVWIGGFSAGSAMAGLYACSRPQSFRGLLLSAGLPPATCPLGAFPRVQITHGFDDQVVAYGGGPQTLGETTAVLAGVPLSAGSWALSAGCDPAPAVRLLGTFGTVEVAEWTGCDAGGEVSLVSIRGLAHDWPGPRLTGIDRIDPGCVALRTITERSGDPFASCLVLAGR